MDFHVLQEIERLRHLFVVIHRHDDRFHLIVLEDSHSSLVLSLQIVKHFSEGPRDSRCAEISSSRTNALFFDTTLQPCLSEVDQWRRA